MTNEEYRQYVHQMYIENFVNKNKKPKCIQIFGDSYGQFSIENTWPYFLSKKIDCPVISYAFSGANNIRSFNMFHHYYDPDCLNIFLYTSSNRLYINDNLWSMPFAQDGNNVHIVSWNIHLTDEMEKNYTDAATMYFKYLHNECMDEVNHLLLLDKILKMKNVVILKCFPSVHIDHNCSTFTEKFLKFYRYSVPSLFNFSLYDLSLFQFFDGEKDGSIMNLEVCQNQLAKANKKYYEFFKIKLPNRGTDAKNHWSRKVQEEVSTFLYSILTTGTGDILLKNFIKPTMDEIVLTSEYNNENIHRYDTTRELNIQLLPQHDPKDILR